MPNAPPPAVLPPCPGLWFDARKEDGLVAVGAFCHGVATRLTLPDVFAIPHAEAYAVPIGLLMLESSLPDLDTCSLGAAALRCLGHCSQPSFGCSQNANYVASSCRDCAPMLRLRGRVFVTHTSGTANPAGDLASRSGKDESGLQHVERLQRLCNALGVPLRWVEYTPQAVTTLVDRAARG